MYATIAGILAALSVVLLLAALGLWLWRRGPGSSKALPEEWNLTPRPVFSSDERRMYRLLREALPHHFILAKLPLLRFTQPVDPSEVRYWYGLLNGVHVTFAVCSPTGRVLAAIDLDPERGGSSRAQQIKQLVLGACRVRYLRCRTDPLPTLAELQQLVPPHQAHHRAPPAPWAAAARDDDVASAPGSHGHRAHSVLWKESGVMPDPFLPPRGPDDGHGLGLPDGAVAPAPSGMAGTGPAPASLAAAPAATAAHWPPRVAPPDESPPENWASGVIIDTPTSPQRPDRRH